MIYVNVRMNHPSHQPLPHLRFPISHECQDESSKPQASSLPPSPNSREGQGESSKSPASSSPPINLFPISYERQDESSKPQASSLPPSPNSCEGQGGSSKDEFQSPPLKKPLASMKKHLTVGRRLTKHTGRMKLKHAKQKKVRSSQLVNT